MTNARGGIVLVTSDDCNVNAASLCSALNDFVWTSDGGEWLTSDTTGKDIFVHWDDFNTKNPNVFLEKELCYREVESGESPSFSLKDFSEAIAPSIYEGWIEIACTANKANRKVYLETLRIEANGNAERKRIEFDSVTGIKNNFENYSIC